MRFARLDHRSEKSQMLDSKILDDVSARSRPSPQARPETRQLEGDAERALAKLDLVTRENSISGPRVTAPRARSAEARVAGSRPAPAKR
jgi:BMFP domain-containing protein YqiC